MLSSRLAEASSIKVALMALFSILALCGGIFLLKRLGIDFYTIASIFHWLVWPVTAILLAVGVVRLPREMLSYATDCLFESEHSRISRSERISAVKVGVFFLALFAILLAKNAPYLRSQFEIRWHIAFLNYDLAWRTPVLSLAGNVLYQFDIQPAFNTSLAPLNAAAYFVNPSLRIVASFTLFYLAMSALLWVVGSAFGLRPVALTVCAGLTALIATIPYGLDHILPFIPPPFDFVSQAMATTIYEELGILSLAAAVLFLWIGQRRSFTANFLIGIAFSASCYIVLLAYPALAFFSVPVVFFYCCAFLATAMGRREFWWKIIVGGILLLTMLVAQIPLFFKNLYSGTFGAYFSDRIMNADRLLIWKYSTVLGVFCQDSRVLLLYLISLSTAFFFAVRGRGAIRRFGIGLLTCETGIFVMGSVVAYLHYPVALFYSDQLQAPILVIFFVLPLIFVTVILLVRGDEVIRRILKQAEEQSLGSWILGHRKKWGLALAVLILAASPFLVPTERPFNNSSYPPARPPSVQILADALALSPGKVFGGRVFTLVQQNFPATSGSDLNPLLNAVLSIIEDHYGRYTGNDHWNDLLSLNIPVVGEYAQWATPINFIFSREFFGRKDDIFQKSLFILRAYNERVARMIGIRYVVTDSASVPGGALVYQRMAGDVPLRLFRIDGTNLGQFSPTRLTRIATAAEAIAAIKSPSFDPEQDAVVEEAPPANLVPGKLQSLTVEAGPMLHVQAQSEGTSLLVLPFEYSHCLRLMTKGDTSARLIPVNLQQIGLLFDHHADVEITYGFGPLQQPECRGDDLKCADGLRLREAL